MELKEYGPLALLTCARGTRKHDLTHAILGMITEAGELADSFKRELAYGLPLDVVNVKEEIGDCLWCANLAADTLGLPLTPSGTLKLDVSDTLSMVFGAAGAAAACGCILVMDGHPDYEAEPDEAADMLDAYVTALQKISANFGFTLEDAAEVNIAKLRKRFPDGFSEEAAVNRDVAAERTVLEGQA